jgi:hypothetical protein
MTSHAYQQEVQVTVPATGSVDVPIQYNSVLEKLTVWAASGPRVVTGLSVQARLNGVNVGAAVPITGVAAATLVFQAAGGAQDGFLLPVGKLVSQGVDPFVFDLSITSTHTAAQQLTLYVAAIAHPGG